MKDKIFNVYFSVKNTLQRERGFKGERIHSSVAVYFLIEILGWHFLYGVFICSPNITGPLPFA